MAERALDWRSLLPVSIHTLCAATLLQFDLYYQKDKSARLALYRNRDFPLTQADLDRLLDRGIQTLYIRSEESSNYRKYLQEHLLDNESVAPVRRYQVLKEATRAIFMESLQSKDVSRSVEITESLGSQLVETICRSNITLRDILLVMAHDYGTYTHAMNVATFALLLAQGLGIRSEGELIRIGQGALLHDIGKQYVPVKILEKSAPLNDQERQTLMTHATRGFLELSACDELDWPQLMMVYQHHERCDGRGYPSALHRGEIHEHARICAITDVCDALMRDRPYRKASLRGDVIEYFDRQAGRGFDEGMTRCWIAILTKHS